MIMNIMHYISAHRRLEESNKTIRLLGGENQVDVQFLAQNDMIKAEVEFYREKMITSSINTILMIFCILTGLAAYFIVTDKI